MVDDVLGRNADGGVLRRGDLRDRPRGAAPFVRHMIALRSVDYAAVFVVGTVALTVGLTLDQPSWPNVGPATCSPATPCRRQVDHARVPGIGRRIGRLASPRGVGRRAGVRPWSRCGIARSSGARRPTARVLGSCSDCSGTSLLYRRLLTVGMALGLMPYLITLIVADRLSTGDAAYYLRPGRWLGSF